MPKIKKRIVVVQTETKPRNSHGFQCGRRRICGNLAYKKLKERSLVWVPKGSVLTQNKDDGAMKVKGRRRVKKQLLSRRFAPIINIIGPCIIHILHVCLCHGIHPLVCLVIPQLLILILGMDVHMIEGCQIILLIAQWSLVSGLKYFYLAYTCFCR